MISKLRIKNFRSIKDEIELSFTPTSIRGLGDNLHKLTKKDRLLKTNVIFGPNASGKSNILRAVKAIEFLIHHSLEFKPGDEIGPYEPHALDTRTAEEPVSLGIEFFASNKIKYEFQFTFCSKKIRNESLFYYPKGQKTLLFKREEKNPIKFGESYRGGKKIIEKQLLENQLFFSKAALNNAESVLVPYQFLLESVRTYPFLGTYTDNRLSRLYAKRIAEEKKSSFAKKFNMLICALDTGIHNIISEEVDWSSYEFPDNIPKEIKANFKEEFKYDIKSFHKVFKDEKEVKIIPFDIEDESVGTQSLLVISGLIIDALENGSVLVVDEFEKNLHPEITQYLIRLFHNPITNPQNAQLLFATHDITQLDSDIFRRDQVWFTEKDEFGVTSLFRCSDFKGLKLNIPLAKWYKSGRFGATPIINDLNFLLEMQQDAK